MQIGSLVTNCNCRESIWPSAIAINLFRFYTKMSSLDSLTIIGPSYHSPSNDSHSSWLATNALSHTVQKFHKTALRYFLISQIWTFTRQLARSSRLVALSFFLDHTQTFAPLVDLHFVWHQYCCECLGFCERSGITELLKIFSKYTRVQCFTCPLSWCII